MIMSDRRAKVFRIATRLATGHSSNPAWYYRNVLRLHRILNGETPFGTQQQSFTRFESQTGIVRAL